MDLDGIAREFDLGSVIGAAQLSGGGPEVVRLRTNRGDFVIKRPWDRLDVEVYAEVEAQLNREGIRQAHQLRRPDGELLSSSGHSVQEFLSGTIGDRPGPVQTANTMTHLAEFDRALAGVEVPAALAGRDTVWARVVRPGYLLEQLPTLIARHAPAWLDPAPVDRLLAALEAGADDLAAEPTQLVHGDLGPDNVLYDGDDVVALIDFTPFHDSVLLGLTSAVFFFQVQGVPSPPARAELTASFDAYVSGGGKLDPAVAWTALVREALRRLATPLAVAEDRGTPLREEMTRLRYRAAVNLAAILT